MWCICALCVVLSDLKSVSESLRRWVWALGLCNVRFSLIHWGKVWLHKSEEKGFVTWTEVSVFRIKASPTKFFFFFYYYFFYCSATTIHTSVWWMCLSAHKITVARFWWQRFSKLFTVIFWTPLKYGNHSAFSVFTLHPPFGKMCLIYLETLLRLWTSHKAEQSDCF